MASRIIEGMGVGLMSVIGPSLIAMWFPEAKRGLPMSIWAAYQMGAQAVMFFLGARAHVQLRLAGRVVVRPGLACVVALVLYILCVKSPRPEDSYADVESADVSIAEGVKSPSAWVLSLATMLFCVGCFGFVNWIATCWAQTFGVERRRGERVGGLLLHLRRDRCRHHRRAAEPREEPQGLRRR